MKETLLQIVQSILSDMDSEDVNTLSDSNEALQVASVVKDTYYNIIAARKIPEHMELMKVTAASDTDYPTHFQYGDSVKSLSNIWYEDSDGNYKEIRWLEPFDFLNLTDAQVDDYTVVFDKNGATKLRIGNDEDPSYYTSFDDEWIVMDSHKSSVDTTLQQSKVRAYGVKYPTFPIADATVPDIDATLFPYLKAEAKSVCFSLFKSGSDPKVEQAARRLKGYIQNDQYKTERKRPLSTYGRT